MQKRAWANGKSVLTVNAATLSPRALSSSAKRLVCLLQTGVSSEGTTLKRRALPAVSASDTTASPAPTASKSGALSPGLSLGPTSVIGLPLNVTSPLRAFGHGSFTSKIGTDKIAIIRDSSLEGSGWRQRRASRWRTTPLAADRHVCHHLCTVV